MSHFASILDVSPLPDGRSWVLRKPLVYELNGDKIMVPCGFVTDFASVPRLVWWAVAPWGRHGNAAVVHDYLYWAQRAGYTREESDRVFLEAMHSLGCLVSVRYAMWAAVRVFGWVAWHRNALDKAAGVVRFVEKLPLCTEAMPPRGLERIVRDFWARWAA